MAEQGRGGGPGVVGRTEELAGLAGVINAACAGQAGTALILGDPGVGKTALVAAACATASAAEDSRVHVLKGAALPMGSSAVPYLALRSAFRSAPADRGPVPLLHRASGESLANMPLLIDDWLTALTEDGPVVLAVDDLHWADQGTLDVLMYLIAGPAERRLAVLATSRLSEAHSASPLREWLADVRRLPGVEVSTLQPLDRPGTEALLARLLGAPPRQSLVTEVFARSAGNPYLTSLLARGLTAADRRLGPGLPTDLRAAVLRSWHGLPDQARLLTAMLAVGGREVDVRDLRRAAAGEVPPDAVVPLLRAAAAAGILDLSPDGTYWFHHPLIAETLVQTLSADERQRWHGAFAAVYGELAEAHDAERLPLRLIALADHHHYAGNTEAAYRWALRAAGTGDGSITPSDRLRMLRRAVALRERVPSAPEAPRELWEAVRSAARDAGDFTAELEAVDALLAVLDPQADPLAVAELMIRRMHLRWSTGEAFFDPAVAAQAVRLAEAEPRSWQHAYALSEHAHALMWRDRRQGGALAQRALAIAVAAGNPLALTYARAASAMAALAEGRNQEAVALTAEAIADALSARDFWAAIHAVMWHANAQLPTMFLREYADIIAEGRRRLEAHGSPHAYTAKLAAIEAESWLAVGEWRRTLAALRNTLGADPGPIADVSARLTAARLAALQGRNDDALAHLARAEELSDNGEAYLNLDFAAIRAEVYAACGRPAESFAAAMAGATRPGPPPTMCEWLVMQAARALADQAQDARDSGRHADSFVSAADDLQRRFPRGLHEIHGDHELYLSVLTALHSLYLAELGRARADRDNAAAWAAAADACGAASLRWEEAYACRRTAEAFLLHRRASRAQGSAFLRRGLALAAELQARAVLEALDQLASQARIPTGPVAQTHDAGPARLPGLTPREAAILDYVVAGRTYGEIARELVISEKTVSSHISSLLRKTGAANRVDLARMAAHAQRDVAEKG
ncbi:AAA family ATPase [Sinomonas flava]|uniref:AAA family ATPase n=1 Tax=Sinomonas flava TaxID=496857 RepID=UPI0031D62938